MNLYNKTKNQHFISQAEQRLNAINPEAKFENQKLYAFSLTDRENYGTQIVNPTGSKIVNNLSETDLFTFNIADKNIRGNFESLFWGYETSIFQDTKKLLSSLGHENTPINNELIKIFLLKFTNFMRNPYSVKKVLNTIGEAVNYRPLVPPFDDYYKRILSSEKKQINYLCQKYGFTETEYLSWIKSLFMLLIPIQDGYNIIEYSLKDLFENKNEEVSIFIYLYSDIHSDKSPLISDRGFVMPFQQSNDHFGFSFNLSANAFISFSFLNLDSLDSNHIPSRMLNIYKALPKTIKVRTFWDDLNALQIYNRHVVYQCHKHVFSNQNIIYGI
jgi:hypothetical protein